jgi:hypothetical protein
MVATLGAGRTLQHSNRSARRHVPIGSENDTGVEVIMDMGKDIFAEQSYGKAALKKLAPIPENFRLYKAGWLGTKPEEWSVMEVTGAVFEIAKRGPNKGKRCILVKGTKRTAFVTREEMRA